MGRVKDAGLAHVAANWTPVRRQELAPSKKSKARSDSIGTDRALDRISNEARPLEMMLDYAIIEGAALRLPLFVLLLRAAQLELTEGLAGRRGPGCRRNETKLRDCLAACGVDSVGAPAEHPQGSLDLVQEW